MGETNGYLRISWRCLQEVNDTGREHLKVGLSSNLAKALRGGYL